MAISTGARIALYPLTPVVVAMDQTDFCGSKRMAIRRANSDMWDVTQAAREHLHACITDKLERHRYPLHETKIIITRASGSSGSVNLCSANGSDFAIFHLPKHMIDEAATGSLCSSCKWSLLRHTSSLLHRKHQKIDETTLYLSIAAICTIAYAIFLMPQNRTTTGYFTLGCVAEIVSRLFVAVYQYNYMRAHASQIDHLSISGEDQQAALGGFAALHKEVLDVQKRRRNSLVWKIFATRSGNVLCDFAHPANTSRREHFRQEFLRMAGSDPTATRRIQQIEDTVTADTDHLPPAQN